MFNICLCNSRSVVVIDSDGEDEEDDAEFTEEDESDDEVYVHLTSSFDLSMSADISFLLVL